HHGDEIGGHDEHRPAHREDPHRSAFVVQRLLDRRDRRRLQARSCRQEHRGRISGVQPDERARHLGNAGSPGATSQVMTNRQPRSANAGDLARRWEGLRAHNRWLADFCADLPGRRAGIAQVLLHDVDAAVAEIEWAHAAGLTGGVLLPGAPPGSGLPPLYAPDYEPIWAACEELGVPINHHTGSASPDYGDY